MALRTTANMIDLEGLESQISSTDSISNEVGNTNESFKKTIQHMATEALAGTAGNQLGVTGEDIVKEINKDIEAIITLKKLMAAIKAAYSETDAQLAKNAEGQAV
jgi:uncharacterized protein YukE